MVQTLYHSPARIIRKLLLDQGLASSSGDWQCFYAREPNTPDNCLSVFGTAGTGGGSLMVTGELTGHDGFQIRIRAKDHDTGRRKADAIQTELAEVVYQQTVTIIDESITYTYTVWSVLPGDVLDLGTEDAPSARSVFTINCTSAIDQNSP